MLARVLLLSTLLLSFPFVCRGDIFGSPDTITVSGTVTASNTTGNIAHDSADSGNPVKTGYRADTTFQTAVADGDRVDALGDVYGVGYSRCDHPNSWQYHSDGSSALTDSSVKAAPGSGLSVYVTYISVSTGAATALNFFLEEGSTKVYGPKYLEAVAGRSYVHGNGCGVIYKATANTAVTITTSAAIAHSVDIKGFVAP